MYKIILSARHIRSFRLVASIEKVVNRINQRVTGEERDFDWVIVISFSRKMVENRSFSTGGGGKFWEKTFA